LKGETNRVSIDIGGGEKRESRFRWKERREGNPSTSSFHEKERRNESILLFSVVRKRALGEGGKVSF